MLTRRSAPAVLGSAGIGTAVVQRALAATAEGGPVSPQMVDGCGRRMGGWHHWLFTGDPIKRGRAESNRLTTLRRSRKQSCRSCTTAAPWIPGWTARLASLRNDTRSSAE
jgi:hypothetical protein